MNKTNLIELPSKVYISKYCLSSYARYNIVMVVTLFSQICRMLQSSLSTHIFDEEQKVPYVYQDDDWIGYEDEQSLQEKVNKKCLLTVCFYYYLFIIYV